MEVRPAFRVNGQDVGARIARGAGMQPADVNRLLKQYDQMERMMRKIGNPQGMRGMLRGLKGMTGGGLPRLR